MRGLILSLVALVFLFSYGFCAQESYPRPWENNGWIAQNEHISALGAWEFWHVTEPTMNISQMDALALMFPFQESLEQSDVDALYAECGPGFCVSKDELGTSLRYAGWAGEAITYTQADQIFMATLHTDPAAGIYSWNLYSYVGNWKNAMDYALMAAEMEGVELNAKRVAMESQVGKIKNSGICDRDYAGPANDLCNSEPDDVMCNGSGLWDEVPDMSWYAPCVRAEWNASESLGAEAERLDLEFNEAVDQLEVMRGLVDGEASLASEAIAELKANELNKIYLSGQSTDIAGTASIRVGYARMLSEYSEAEASVKYSEKMWNNRKLGWYKLLYAAMYDANGKYENVISGSEELMVEAEEVVLAMRAQAHSELVEAEGAGGQLTENGRYHLELAQQACTLGDAELLLGLKFDDYGICRMHAKMALRNMETEGSTELDVAISEARSAIAGAEDDGIDVSMEKALLSIVEKKKPANSLSILQRIRESLPGKAEIKYSGLPEERSRLIGIINSGGAGFAFLKTWFGGEECYSGDELDYWCALGMLSDMEDAYSKIDDEIMLRSDEAVANALILDYYETSTAASLVDESRYELVVSAENPLGIGAENVVFEVPASVEVRSIDLTEGSELVRAVAYEQGVAIMQLRNMSPGGRATLHFVKSYVPCRSTDYSKTSVGDGNGNAIVTEAYELECSVAVDAIDTGSEARKAVLDGMQRYLQNGILSGGVEEGRHELELETEVDGAYVVSEGERSVATIGMKTYVEYMLDITSTVDLDSIPIIVDESEKNPAKIEIIAYTGERISNKRALSSGIVYFEVQGIDASQTAQIKVKYEFSDSSEYVEQRIEQMRNTSLSNEARAYLNNASNLYNIGDYDGAMAALEDAEAQVEKEAKARAKILQKHQELYDEISKKVSDLRGSIELAESLGVGGRQVDEMRARVGYLEGMLNKNLTGTESVSPLEEVDLGWEGKELTKIQKYLNENEARIKKDWMKLGLEDANTSNAIENLEEAGAAFSGTMRFRDGVLALAAVEDADAKLAAAKEIAAGMSEEEKNALARIIEDAKEVSADYAAERNAVPRGHYLASLFEKSPSWIENRLDSLEGSADIDGAITEATSLKGEMNGVISFLKKEAERLGKTAGELYDENKDGMDENARNEIETMIGDAEGYLSNKEYAKAVIAYENAISAIEGAEGGDYGLLILAITALLVIGIVLFLLLGRTKIGLPRSGGGPQVKKLKKMPKDEDFE